MKKQELTLYSYDELDEKTKERLLKEEIESQKEFHCENCLYDDLMSEAYEQLNSLFENVDEIRLLYDFSYSQGSGLLTEFTFTFKNQLVRVKQNPYNHWYTFNSNYILEFEDEDSISKEDEKELRQKITTLNADLEKLGYSIIEDEDFYRKEAIDFLTDDKLYFKNGKVYIENEY